MPYSKGKFRKLFAKLHIVLTLFNFIGNACFGALRLSVAKIAISGTFWQMVCLRGVAAVYRLRDGVSGLGMLKGLIYGVNMLKIKPLKCLVCRKFSVSL